MIFNDTNVEKAFDSVNHLFLITALEIYDFKVDFVNWIQILIQNTLLLMEGQQKTI